MKEQTTELADTLYRDKVLRARAQDSAEKLVQGFRLFESALDFTKAGVAAELDTTDEDVVMKGVLKRFERVRKVREAGLYRPPIRKTC